MNKLKTIATILLVIIFSQLFAGGGWTSGKKKGFFKLGQSLIIANKYYSPSGSIIDISTTGSYFSSLYAEYGLTDKIDVVAYVPFFVRSTVNRQVNSNGDEIQSGDALQSFGDMDIAVKYGLYSGPVVIASTLTFGIPTGIASGGKFNILQTGDGEFNQMLTLDISKGFDKLYASSKIGYNNRSNNFSDEIRYGAEVGVKVLKQSYITLALDGNYPIDNDVKAISEAQGLFSNKVEYLGIITQFIYGINEKSGVTISFNGALYAKRILASPIFGVGYYYKLNQ